MKIQIGMKLKLTDIPAGRSYFGVVVDIRETPYCRFLVVKCDQDTEFGFPEGSENFRVEVR